MVDDKEDFENSATSQCSGGVNVVLVLTVGFREIKHSLSGPFKADAVGTVVIVSSTKSRD